MKADLVLFKDILVICREKGMDILTIKSKGKQPQPPFLPFSPTPLQLHKKYITSKGFVIFFVELIVRIAMPGNLKHPIRQDAFP